VQRVVASRELPKNVGDILEHRALIWKDISINNIQEADNGSLINVGNFLKFNTWLVYLSVKSNVRIRFYGMQLIRWDYAWQAVI
jgi:hypothetical protein